MYEWEFAHETLARVEYIENAIWQEVIMKRQLIYINTRMKKELDTLFERKPNLTAEDVTNLFKTEWVYVNESVGSVPKEYANAYDDVMDFMMTTGELVYPENYYTDWYISQATADALANCYRYFDGYHYTVEQLIQYLYSNGVLEFSNVHSHELKEISAKYIPRKIGKNLGVRLFKPRYYTLKRDGNSYWKPEWTLICQPDRRKNLFITVTNRWGKVLVMSPWQVVIDY